MIGAKCLVFPSLFEGFGIPVVEAMARGIPVACSNTTSLPEVGGDLACYFDPCDAVSIADAVSKAIALRNDAAFCSQLREHAAKFNFQATARRILDALARPVNPTQRAGEVSLRFRRRAPGPVVWRSSRARRRLMAPLSQRGLCVDRCGNFREPAVTRSLRWNELVWRKRARFIRRNAAICG